MHNDLTDDLTGAPYPGVQRMIAPNPSPMTERGTNTYLVGHDRLTIIDPGPDFGPNDERHLTALLDAVRGRKVDRIVVTHSHLDHSGMAPALSRAMDAPVLAFGDSVAGRSAVMTVLAASGLIGGGEGVDLRFQPDQTVLDGAVIATDGGPLTVIHTPGHFGNHICLHRGDAVFSGDHVMGWATSLVSPPDGDLTDFMRSLDRLSAVKADLLLPGHGAVVVDPATRIAALIAHRQKREAQIIAALRAGPATIPALTATVYSDTAPALHPAAARNVFAHLIDLTGRNIVHATPTLAFSARFVLA